MTDFNIVLHDLINIFHLKIESFAQFYSFRREQR